MTITTDPATVHPVDHDHVADLDACLAFINTLELDGTDGLPDDHIPTLDDAIGWFGARSLAHEAALRAQAERDPDAWLARVGDCPGRAARGLGRHRRGAIGRPGRRRAASTTRSATWRRPSSARRWRASRSAIGTRPRTRSARRSPGSPRRSPRRSPTGDTTGFRICANDACRWVFEDTSRGGRRRWCDMQSCGNRAKVRRFRSRQRAEDAASTWRARQGTRTPPAAGPPRREPQPRSSSGLTSVAKRTIDSSSYIAGMPAMRCR